MNEHREWKGEERLKFAMNKIVYNSSILGGLPWRHPTKRTTFVTQSIPSPLLV